MITEDERFIEIQSILAMSDVHPADCIKINDLIIQLSKENKQLQNNWNELNKYINNRFYAIEFDYNNKIIDKFELVVRQNELLKLKEVIKNLEGKSE